ncbi:MULTISPECIES: hypothetical protein [unclassified Rhizobium]|uniref:hypothetical protein n=1 Tax=unclassified Rhizobium TaxID=2613769 RepID=UPI000BCF5AE4|nr:MULTISPECIES: hypothetical protein [unclassified Rhizobium]MDH7806858.1 hypothetical protein [Rhizobium sp. AN67]MDQ4408140.1 hypothetical protein [Rhizobium sp. AN63]SOD57677.1 hypothetical protein SAMN05216595_3809 [Rhizobium sp. AN6A]
MDTESHTVNQLELTKQIYRSFLDSLYEVDYYREVRLGVASYSQYYDFVIALGTALSGGTGVIGILNESKPMAYVCGAVTLASIVLTAAKQAFDWPSKINFASEMMQQHAAHAARYKIIVDRIQAAHALTKDAIHGHLELLNEQASMPVDHYKALPIVKRRELQAAIQQREAPKTWWKPDPTATMPGF